MEELKSMLKQAGALPYLFIGSGLSRRYINTENWESLLKYVVNCIPNGKNYSYYKNKANRDIQALHKDESLLLPKVASLIEDDFNESWYSMPEFEIYRKKHFKLLDSGDLFSPMKLFISDHLAELQTKINDNLELNSLKKITSKSIAGIITTNYDEFLEKEIFKDFDVIVGQDDLIFSDMFSIENIYKIHGSISDSTSLILNYEDYSKFEEKEAYLASKLLTIFVEHPIIFIGYSISDSNILKLLNRIQLCLSNDKIEKIKNRLFFVDFDENINSDKYKISSHNINAIPLTKITLSNFSLLYDTISENRATFNPKLYKKLKNSIYEVVKTNNPVDSIFAITSDIPDEKLDKIDVIIGFNLERGKLAKKGLQGITSYNLYEDLLFDNLNFEDVSSKDLMIAIHDALSRVNFSAPILKYIPLIQEDFNDGRYLNLKNEVLKREKLAYIVTGTERVHGCYEYEKEQLSFEEILQLDVSLTTKLKRISRIDTEKLNVDDFEQYLKDNVQILSNGKSTERSAYRKLLKIFDWLKYKDNIKILMK